MKSRYALMIMIVAAWLLTIGESYIFFGVIRPLGPPLGIGFKLGLLSSVLKVLATIGLAGGWVGAMWALRATLIRPKPGPKTPTGSS